MGINIGYHIFPPQSIWSIRKHRTITTCNIVCQIIDIFHVAYAHGRMTQEEIAEVERVDNQLRIHEAPADAFSIVCCNQLQVISG
jgi:hypothetical protein